MVDRRTNDRSICITPATIRDASFVLANLRSCDRDEVSALMGDIHPGALACHLLAGTDLAFAASIKSNPVAIFGVSPIWPHVWSGWALGTNEMRRAVPAITRQCLQVIRPELMERGATRLQVYTLPEHDLSHKWLQGMGAKPEGVARGYGRSGQDFNVYAWSRTLPDVLP